MQYSELLIKKSLIFTAETRFYFCFYHVNQ